MHSSSMTAPASTDAHLERFRRVLAYIDERWDGELTLDELSHVAALSKYHFHRQFSVLFGFTVHQYVQLVRLRRASYQLAFRGQRILEIALENGYESHEAFSRAFRKAMGQTPSSFREDPKWQHWFSTQEPLNVLRARHSGQIPRTEDVRRLTFPPTRVAVLEHRGDLRLLGESIRRFIQWRKETRRPPAVSATFNIVYGDPATTAPADHRFDLCAGIEGPVAPNGLGVIEKSIPGGRCAVLRHTGSDHTLFEAVGALYASWLPSSGEELRDFPIYLQRIQFFPDVTEREAITDVFLPLR
jgi:AraC family transcriptional regulator